MRKIVFSVKRDGVPTVANGLLRQISLLEGERRNIHFDHILPHVSGGRTVVPVCDEYNSSKSSKGLKEWLRWLRDVRYYKRSDVVEYNRWKK